jgi:acetyltransferase-like isoleucine patch superfamily enzyme
VGKKYFKYIKVFLYFLIYVLKFCPKMLRRYIWTFTDVLPNIIGVPFRYSLLVADGKKVGDNVYIARNVVIKNSNKLVIGNNVSIHEFCYIDAAGEIEIGDNVSVAHSSSIISFEHTWLDPAVPIKYNPSKYAKVVIDDDVWIGCGARVLAGSRISSRTIVAAGSVVKGELLPNSIYAGVPARLVKKI